MLEIQDIIFSGSIYPTLGTNKILGQRRVARIGIFLERPLKDRLQLTFPSSFKHKDSLGQLIPLQMMP